MENSIKKEEVLVRFEVDLAYNDFGDKTDNFMAYLQEIIEVFKLEIVGMHPVGPGGAWPAITFRGTNENVIKFLMMYFDDDDVSKNLSDYITLFPDENYDFELKSDERFTTVNNRKFISNEGKWILE